MVCLGLLFLTEPEKEEMKMAKWYEEAVFYHMYDGDDWRSQGE